MVGVLRSQLEAPADPSYLLRPGYNLDRHAVAQAVIIFESERLSAERRRFRYINGDPSVGLSYKRRFAAPDGDLQIFCPFAQSAARYCYGARPDG